MKIKKGDQVKVITGKNKGTIAEVIQTLPKVDKVVVEGVNVIKKTVKPTQANPDGGIIEMEAPIHVSNVMAYDEKAAKASRIGFEFKNGKKVRVLKATNTELKGGNE